MNRRVSGVSMVLLLTAAAAAGCGSGTNNLKSAGRATTGEDALVSTLPANSSTVPTTILPEAGPPAEYARLLGKCFDDPARGVDIVGIRNVETTVCDPNVSDHSQIYAFAFSGFTRLPNGVDELPEAESDIASKKIVKRCTSEWQRITGRNVTPDNDVFILSPYEADHFDASKGWAVCTSRTTFKP